MQETPITDGRTVSYGRDWTKGSITKNLLQLSWPIVISQSLNMIGPTIDMIWVGKLGAAPIAGVGVAGTVVMFMTSAIMGLAIGTRAMIARFIGAGDTTGANHVARQAFVISAMFAALMITIGISLAEPILALMGVEPEVVAEGAVYMRIMFVGASTMTFRMMAEGIMQASGDSITPMRIAILFRAVHVALCPFMVLGWWIFPNLGVTGAALTNVISQSLGLALAFWVLFSGKTHLRLTMQNFRVDFRMIWRIIRIGLPASVMATQRGLGHLVLTMFMVPFGTLAVAAHTLWQRVEMVVVMLNMGIGIGAGVLVGQNLGANNPGRAERSGWLALAITQAFVTLCAIAILVWPEYIVRIFNTEPNLIATASSFLRIAATGYFVLSSVVVLENCISGAGDTVPPMLFEIVQRWVIIVPLAFLLPNIAGLGMYGVRWAIVAGMILGAFIYAAYFRLGRWKRKRI